MLKKTSLQKFLLAVSILIFAAIGFNSCDSSVTGNGNNPPEFNGDRDNGSGDNQNGDTSTDTTEELSTDGSGLTAGTTTNYNLSVPSELSSYQNVLYLNLSESKVSSDNSTWSELSTSTVKFFDNKVKIKFTEDSTGASTGVIRINASSFEGELAVYISGTLTSGGVKIQSNATDSVAVFLKDATITSTNYPCLEITKGSPAAIYIEGTNTFADGRAYGTGYGEEYSTTSGKTYVDDDGNTVSCTVVRAAVQEGSDSKGTLYCKGDMTIYGGGSLKITQAYKNCIASKGQLTIKDGTFDLTSKGKNGLMGDSGVQIDDGTINFNGTGAISSSNFRKANGINTDDDDYPESSITINGGTLNITTYNGKGITAPYVYINGGTNTINVTGVTNYTNDSRTTISYYDADGVEYKNQSVNFAAEGIEGEARVEIKGGTTQINATDDGINVSNSSGNFYLKDGNLYVYAERGDGIDSNGNLYIQGGVAISYAPTGSEDSFDSGSRIYITGGTIAGTSGSQMALSEYNTSGQKLLYFTGSSDGMGGGFGGPGGNRPGQSSSSSSSSFSKVAVQVSSSTVYAYTLPSSSWGLFVMTCPDFTSSSSSAYKVYTSPTISTSSTDFNGLCTTTSALNSVSLGSSTSTPSIK